MNIGSYLVSFRSFALMLCLALGSAAKAANLYEVLGVSSEAPASEIKSTWKSLVRKYHPDRFMGDPEGAKAATAKLALINAAEHVIGDATLRAYYDHLSNRGRNHESWEVFPGNTNPEALAKRLGPVVSLQSKPAAVKRWTLETVLEFLADGRVSAEDWKTIYTFVMNKFPQITSLDHQKKMIALLISFDEEWKSESWAKAIVAKFTSVGGATSKLLLDLVHSEKEKLRKIGVSLLFQTLEQDKTHLLEMGRGDAQSLVLTRTSDSSVLVQVRAIKVAKYFGLSKPREASPADILTAIQNLSSLDQHVKDASFRVLLSSQDLGKTELRAITLGLLERQKEYLLISKPQLVLEMMVLLEVLGRTSDLSPVAKEIKVFSMITSLPELRSRAEAMTSRYSCESTLKNSL